MTSGLQTLLLKHFASFYLLRCYTAFAIPPGALAILRGARCSASQAGCQNLSDGLFHFISFNLFHLIVSQIVQGALSGLDSLRSPMWLKMAQVYCFRQEHSFTLPLRLGPGLTIRGRTKVSTSIITTWQEEKAL